MWECLECLDCRGNEHGCLARAHFTLAVKASPILWLLLLVLDDFAAAGADARSVARDGVWRLLGVRLALVHRQVGT